MSLSLPPLGTLPLPVANNYVPRVPAAINIELKRFAKGSILLQSAHFSTLRPTASASQHATPFGLRFSASQLFVSEARPLPTSCWDQSFRELV
jgi:hypothetical protein